MNRIVLLVLVVGVLLSGVLTTRQCPSEEGNRPIVVPSDEETGRHPVSNKHPRLLGSRERLQRLARDRSDAYQRVVRVARQAKSDEHSEMMSMALVTAIEQDEQLGRKAVDTVLKTVDGPIQKGHVTFAHDLARCAIVYDMCYAVITNGNGRLFVQTLLPHDPQIKLHDGQDLYRYGGNVYPPRRDTGPAPECRIEISPSQPARTDYFLHVLTATDATVDSISPAVLEETDSEVRVQAGKATISFDKSKLAGSVEIAGHRRPFPEVVSSGG